jgi:hypothetical protein
MISVEIQLKDFRERLAKLASKRLDSARLDVHPPIWRIAIARVAVFALQSPTGPAWPLCGASLGHRSAWPTRPASLFGRFFC